MPSLRHHHSESLVKLLLMGDSKAGKTSSLLSLVKAGYKLRILDLDNLLDILAKLVERDCPELADNVEYRTIRDERIATDQGYVIKGSPKAFTTTLKMMKRWKYTTDDGEEIDYGNPDEWGPECILVIDSLSRLCDAAYDWRESLSVKGMDGRAIYGDAQDAIESMLAGITAPNCKTNVIVIAHLQYIEQPDGKIRGYPQGIGKALSPKIPEYFPSCVYYSRKGDDRTMFTASTSLINLSNSAPFALSDTYPTESGLAEFFRIMRDQPTKEEPTHRPVTKLTSIRR